MELTLSWTSIPLLEPRLRELVIDSPRLAVRRDAAGVLHVAGIEIDPARDDDNSGFSDWLLRQPQIIVRNALITWLDERRNAPQLILDRVTFRLESGFGGHRFGLTGQPPAELAAPIDIRGDVTGRSIREWQKAEGRFYVRLDYADIAAWHEWLPLPIEINSGKGAMRAWFTFADGQLREVVADVELADVRTRLTPRVDELALSHVSGRAGWRAEGTAREVYCRQLSFRTDAGQVFAPTDASLLLRTNDAGVVEHGRLEFERVELGPLREIAQNLPMTDRWRADLLAFAAQGAVAKGVWRWDGPADAPTSFEGRGDFTDVAWAPHENWPGASGMNGTVKASSRGGEVKLSSRNATITVPQALPQPVTLETLRADVAWTVSDAQFAVHVDDVAFANADLAGKLRATYRHTAAVPGPSISTGRSRVLCRRPRCATRLSCFLPGCASGWRTRSRAVTSTRRSSRSKATWPPFRSPMARAARSRSTSRVTTLPSCIRMDGRR